MNGELQKKIGRLFVCGFDSLSVGDHARFLIRDLRIGNWLYFARNVQSHAQVSALSDELSSETEQFSTTLPFIAMDQEGGIVSRLHGDLNTYPGAMAIAATGNAGFAYEAASITAEHLKVLGVNMNLAPVCDINSNPLNPIIGPRSYGDSAGAVTRFALEAMRGYTDGGIIPVLKHFPGHGDCAVDSHNDLPIIYNSLENMETRELAPFAAGIRAGAPAVMLAHILAPSLVAELGGEAQASDSRGNTADSNTFAASALPASLSQAIISKCLRGRLAFSGLVLSDCLEMMAIQKHYSTARAVLLAMHAGADLLLVSHTAEKQEEGFRSIYDAVLRGELSEDRINASLQRIQAVKDRFGRAEAGNLRTGEVQKRSWHFPHKHLQEISRKSLSLIRDRGFLESRASESIEKKEREGGVANTSAKLTAKTLPNARLADNPRTCIVVVDANEQFIGENKVSGGRPVLGLRKAFPNSVFYFLEGSDLGEGLVQEIAKAEYRRILVLSADAPPATKDFIRSLLLCGEKTGVAVMRSPYEASDYTNADFLVLCYEDTVLAIRSLTELLQGTLRARGSVPVEIFTEISAGEISGE